MSSSANLVVAPFSPGAALLAVPAAPGQLGSAGTLVGLDVEIELL